MMPILDSFLSARGYLAPIGIVLFPFSWEYPLE